MMSNNICLHCMYKTHIKRIADGTYPQSGCSQHSFIPSIVAWNEFEQYWNDIERWIILRSFRAFVFNFTLLFFAPFTRLSMAFVFDVVNPFFYMLCYCAYCNVEHRYCIDAMMMMIKRPQYDDNFQCCFCVSSRCQGACIRFFFRLFCAVFFSSILYRFWMPFDCWEICNVGLMFFYSTTLRASNSSTFIFIFDSKISLNAIY